MGCWVAGCLLLLMSTPLYVCVQPTLCYLSVLLHSCVLPSCVRATYAVVHVTLVGPVPYNHNAIECHKSKRNQLLLNPFNLLTQ